MRAEPIHKTPAERASANLSVYPWTRHDFSWARARTWLSGLPDGGLNIGYEAVDRHALGERRDTVALRCLGRHGEVDELTYGELLLRTNRFANMLRSRGIGAGAGCFPC